MFLETERLLLRKLEEADFADFVAFSADAELCRMMGRDIITDAESARPTFDWLKDHGGYALVLKETGHVIGNLTVGEVPAELAALPAVTGKHGCTLSFSVGRPWQRQGFMTEALRAMIAWLFAEGMDYIQCGCFDFNEPSRRLQEKLGFAYLTTQRFHEDHRELVVIEHILGNPE